MLITCEYVTSYYWVCTLCLIAAACLTHLMLPLCSTGCSIVLYVVLCLLFDERHCASFVSCFPGLFVRWIVWSTGEKTEDKNMHLCWRLENTGVFVVSCKIMKCLPCCSLVTIWESAWNKREFKFSSGAVFYFFLLH